MTAPYHLGWQFLTELVEAAFQREPLPNERLEIALMMRDGKIAELSARLRWEVEQVTQACMILDDYYTEKKL
jgi:hypothetical protein